MRRVLEQDAIDAPPWPFDQPKDVRRYLEAQAIDVLMAKSKIQQGVRRLSVEPDEPDDAPDWSKECESCGAKPVHPATDMCGPCTFGESDTAGGNW